MILKVDFEMHSLQMYTLKQTMLSQEIMFQKQVFELHRLYGIQKTMMQTFGCNDSARDDIPATERTFFSISRVSLEQSIDMRRYRPFDLRLSADEFIIHVGGTDREIDFFGAVKNAAREDCTTSETSYRAEHISDFDPINSGIAQNFMPKDESKFLNAGFLDLNEACADDSSCFSNDPIVTHNHSPESSSPDFSLPVDIGARDEENKTINLSFEPQTGDFSDQKSSILIESECGIIEKEDVSAKFDPSIENAAIVLINMTAENSSHDTNSDQPQRSSDSFEMIALKLSQTSTDDYTVSSRPIENHDKYEKNYGFKIRRGRRLKDFQKEILPGLATLSRQEICEDINILEAVLRSREYKKVRATMEDEKKWCTPARGKRSSVRRRLVR